MTIVLLRHWYPWSDWNLTKEWEEEAEIKWKEVRNLIWEVSDKQIIILSSAAPRCLQSAKNFIEWLWGDTWINWVEELWDDDKHQGNIEHVLAIISQLPPHLVLIIFAHLSNIFPIALELWFEWSYEKIDYLWHLVINNPEKKDITDIKWFKLLDADLERPLEIEMKIPVWEKGVFEIDRIIKNLQKNSWDQIEFKDKMFFVPEIISLSEAKGSMTWTYINVLYFTVIIKTNWEKILKERNEVWFKNNEIPDWKLNNYVNQIEWLRQFFLYFDNTIKPDKWIITKITG